MIEVRNLSRGFTLTKKQQKEAGLTSRSLLAVDGVDFTCQPGRVFSLLGPNGAGKTTTLRMIATLLSPSAGHIRVCGLDTQQDATAVRKKIGFLTNSTSLYPRLNAREIIRYFGQLYGMDKSSIERRREELFTLLGIHDFASKPVGQLSTGMKQKVSIARTMVHDPEVVVFDEPTAGLDVITAEHIIDLIRQCRDAGKTVIFSSHIMSEVDLLCDDLAIIHQGRLRFCGPMSDFRARMQTPNLTQEFIRIIKDVSE